MAKARVPIIIQDPSMVGSNADAKVVEGYLPIRPHFLDGPATESVAVLDLDPDTGAVLPGLRVHNDPGKLPYYEDERGLNMYNVATAPGADLRSREFMQMNVFAAVLRTMDLFESEVQGDEDNRTNAAKPEPDQKSRFALGLGRSLQWAFDGPQLLVVPRAGRPANACYRRDSRSLQFFFSPAEGSHEAVYTCLSRDIVAHETGHAIVDGIARWLMEGYSIEGLAIHEALADLTAVLVAFSSHNLREQVLSEADGSIANPSHFTDMAEEYGMARGHKAGLRNLLNHQTMSKVVDRTDEYALCEVLAGALYQVMIRLHETETKRLAKGREYRNKPKPLFSASGLALDLAARRFRQMIFRALDYLPPGEVSFADYARALIAVDQNAYPGDPKVRDWVRDEFDARGIVTDPAALALDLPPSPEGIQAADLHESDWAAYEFVRQHPDLFNIPAGTSFKVEPRLELVKEGERDRRCHECVFRVSWTECERNQLADTRYPWERRVILGTTLVLDWDTGSILARLTNAPPNPAEKEKDPAAYQRRTDEFGLRREQRDAFLQHLVARGLLKLDGQACGPDGRPLSAAIEGTVVENTLRIHCTANLLNIDGGVR